MQIQWCKNYFIFSVAQIMLTYCSSSCFACAPFPLCSFCLLKPGVTNKISIHDTGQLSLRLSSLGSNVFISPLAWEKNTSGSIRSLSIRSLTQTTRPLSFELPSAFIIIILTYQKAKIYFEGIVQCKH